MNPILLFKTTDMRSLKSEPLSEPITDEISSGNKDKKNLEGKAAKKFYIPIVTEFNAVEDPRAWKFPLATAGLSILLASYTLVVDLSKKSLPAPQSKALSVISYVAAAIGVLYSLIQPNLKSAD